jgi:hypothetical protein
MSRRRTFLSLTALTFAGVFIAFFDSIHTVCSAATGTPRSWIKPSSPMREHLAYVWEHWEDPDLKESAAIQALSAILQRELTADSNSEEIKEHILAHFQKPDFSGTGASPATQWCQNAHGFTAFFMDDYRILHVRYFSRKDRFLYADVYMGRPKGKDMRHIELTHPADHWAQPAHAGSKPD